MSTTLPPHLPARLTICLWDFTWYTRTMPSEPFHDLDAAFDEAAERGFNTVRICAAPLLLFGEHTIDTSSLHFVNMGGDVGQRTRWYDAAGGAVLNGRDHLLALFRSAERHGMFVIVSSWEYQQSPAFLAEPSWYEMVSGIPPQERHVALARAESRLLEWLGEHGLKDRVAYVEVHNEVDLGRLTEVADPAENTFWAQRPYLESALNVLQADHPDVLSTVCYGKPPYLDMTALPDNAQVAHAHLYIYGVLAALEDWTGVRDRSPGFPRAELQGLLREDAPAFSNWRAEIESWRLEATGISTHMFYAYDWVDTTSWDAWLYEHYQEHVRGMRDGIREQLEAFSTWARHHDVPAVVGEGWIGYTPLNAEFEDGPAGQALARYAVAMCADLGFWGTLPGSNSAPHHPGGWRNVQFQCSVNDLFSAAR